MRRSSRSSAVLLQLLSTDELITILEQWKKKHDGMSVTPNFMSVYKCRLIAATILDVKSLSENDLQYLSKLRAYSDFLRNLPLTEPPVSSCCFFASKPVPRMAPHEVWSNFLELLKKHAPAKMFKVIQELFKANADEIQLDNLQKYIDSFKENRFDFANLNPGVIKLFDDLGRCLNIPTSEKTAYYDFMHRVRVVFEALKPNQGFMAAPIATVRPRSYTPIPEEYADVARNLNDIWGAPSRSGSDDELVGLLGGASPVQPPAASFRTPSRKNNSFIGSPDREGEADTSPILTSLPSPGITLSNTFTLDQLSTMQLVPSALSDTDASTTVEKTPTRSNKTHGVAFSEPRRSKSSQALSSHSARFLTPTAGRNRRGVSPVDLTLRAVRKLEFR